MCQEVECQRPAIARGLCHKHYQRARRRGEIQIESAYGAGLDFLRTLPETDDCIEWPFGRFTTGYGNVKVDGRNRTAHSVSYELPVHRPRKLVEARGTVRRVLHEEPADTRLQQTQVLNVGRVHMELVGQPLERDPRFQSEDLDPDDDAHRVQVDDDAVAYLTSQTDVTIPPLVFVWLNAIVAGTALIIGLVSRIMAVPGVNAFLQRIGLGAAPASAFVREKDETGTYALVTPDPKAPAPPSV